MVRVAGRVGWLAVLLGTLPAPASAATPPPIWDGVRQVQILCLATDARGANIGPLRDTLCRAARDRAAVGAPVPVTILAQPGRQVLAPATVTLLVQASVSTTAAGRLLALTVRPYRNQAEDGGTLFGAAPRAALLPATSDDPAIAALVRAAIDDTIPWRQRAAPRRLSG